MFKTTVHPSRLRGRVVGLALILGAALVIAACSGDDDEPEPTTSTTTSTSTTTTTTEPPTLSMLTGLPVEDESVNERPVVAVKIASDANARPQVGLETADVVVEELVEGGISRFLAAFQSTDSDPVGPMRSARTSEIDLLPLFGRPIFAHSGGNPGTMSAVRSSPGLINAGPDSAYGFLQFRDGSRPRPNNLFTETSTLREEVGDNAAAPTAWFGFLGEDDDPPAGAVPAIGVDLSFGSTNTRWVWDSEREAFLRWQDRVEHMSPDEQQLGFANVVILATTYGTSPADPGSPEARTVGDGTAWVLSNGWLVEGTWERAAVDAPYVLRDSDGEEIRLGPGRIWMALPRGDRSVPTFLESDPRVSE